MRNQDRAKCPTRTDVPEPHRRPAPADPWAETPRRTLNPLGHPPALTVELLAAADAIDAGGRELIAELEGVAS